MDNIIEIIRIIDGPDEDQFGVYMDCMTTEGREEIYFDNYDDAYEVMDYLSKYTSNYRMEVEEIDEDNTSHP